MVNRDRKKFLLFIQEIVFLNSHPNNLDPLSYLQIFASAAVFDFLEILDISRLIIHVLSCIS